MPIPTIVKCAAVLAVVAIALGSTALANSANEESDLPSDAVIVPPTGGTPPAVFPGVILLDADTPATGSQLDMQPLATPWGTVSWTGEIRDSVTDPDMPPAGAVGDGFDIDNSTSTAELQFNFDVASFTFIYGGNIGVCDIVARNSSGGIVDSFFQESTDDGWPVGPETLSGTGIRSVLWQDPGNGYLVLDNIHIVPEGAISVSPSSWGKIKCTYR